MSEENRLDIIRNNLSNVEFLARTKSKSMSGISIVFHPPNIMDVRGGNLDLPPGMFLRLNNNSVNYHFDPKIFDSVIERSHDLNYNTKAEIVRKEIDKAVSESSYKNLDDSWQILRLLDPRFLLMYENFEIVEKKRIDNLLQIKIQYNITNFLKRYFPKVDANIIHEILKEETEQRIATIYIDDNDNLKKIKQEELFSKDIISTSYDYPKYNITEEIIARI